MRTNKEIKYCPFNVTIKQQNQYVYDFDENNNMRFENHILIEKQEPTQCKKKKCALWRFGKCIRK